MSDEGNTTLETKGLDQLLKALKAKPPEARVGILGQKAVRTDSKAGPNNAEVGAAHEFGTATLPQRSFLRVPIAEHLEKRMESSGALDKETLQEVIRNGTILPWMKKIAVLAEGIVKEAFDTTGFGKWPPSNMRYKAVKQTLVETQQLRNAITSDVKETT